MDSINESLLYTHTHTHTDLKRQDKLSGYSAELHVQRAQVSGYLYGLGF